MSSAIQATQHQSLEVQIEKVDTAIACLSAEARLKIYQMINLALAQVKADFKPQQERLDAQIKKLTKESHTLHEKIQKLLGEIEQGTKDLNETRKRDDQEIAQLQAAYDASYAAWSQVHSQVDARIRALERRCIPK